jgi:uncharacterized membrane protein
VSVTSWQGPLPPAEELQRFEQIAPGSARLIIEQWIKQSDHRMEIESVAVRGAVAQARLGAVLGFLAALAGVGVSGYAVHEGYGIEALATIILELGGLAGVFVWNSRNQRDERARKAELMARQQRER